MSNMQKLMRSPRSLDLEITSRCNLRCRYCYFFENSALDYRELSTDEWLQFFDECGRCAIMNVTLSGGEPFMREDLTELIKGIIRNRMRFSILSNGSLVRDEMAAFIAESGRCDSIQISVDGSSGEIHDAYRGKGAFSGAIQGIRCLQQHGLETAVRITIHRRNVYYLEDIVRFLLEELKLPSVSTNSVGYLGSCRRYGDELLLTIQEREFAMQTLLKLSNDYNGRISAMAGPLAEARTWRKMEDARRERAMPFSHGGFLSGCGCPTHKMSVRADGAFLPCMMLPHMTLGRINQDSLKEIWQDSASLKQLRERHKISLSEFEHCAGCPYIPYCTGNCPALAYTSTGQVNHPSPNACLRKFLADGGHLCEPADA